MVPHPNFSDLKVFIKAVQSLLIYSYLLTNFSLRSLLKV